MTVLADVRTAAHVAGLVVAWWTPAHVRGVLALASALAVAVWAPSWARSAWAELRLRVGTVAVAVWLAVSSAAPRPAPARLRGLVPPLWWRAIRRPSRRVVIWGKRR